jgi:hypothetical protein
VAWPPPVLHNLVVTVQAAGSLPISIQQQCRLDMLVPLLVVCIAPKVEGLMKGTKRSIEDIGPDTVGFCGGGIARFSNSMKQTTPHENERKDNSTQVLVYLPFCSDCFSPQAPPYASRA